MLDLNQFTGFTPGPWKACFPVGNEPFISNEGYVVINKVGHMNQLSLAQANARLIAAAPELLEECKRLQAIVKQYEEIVDHDIALVNFIKAEVKPPA